eukprot:TRINITY_DN91500_c0_g1_i1.p1 TRINITY_DN91500_c0_g1~~TRINITY_DN91500_c0_g1_i1.p1  ORF type:complete len:433 (+),score=70.17 TRINITY_DN91500_c0_g1_i1:75-1373(+)
MTVKKRVPLLMASVVALGSLNSFAGRIKAETLGKYSGVVSGVVDAVVFMLFYLVVTTLQGPVAQRQLPKVLQTGKSWEQAGSWKFLFIAGVSDQIGMVFGFIAQPYLTPLMYSLMNQAIVPFTVLLSMIMLASRYIALELFAVCLVAGAAIACVLSSGSSNGANNVGMAALTASTTCFPAGAFVLKELAFRDWSQRFRNEIEDSEEEPLNIFVVGSVCAIVSLCVSVPVALAVQSFESASPVETFLQGFNVLVNGDHTLVCYTAYIFVNLAFNLALLLLVRNASALLAFLSLKLTVPCVALLSPLPWPIIGPSPVTSTEWAVMVLMIGGVVAFRYGNQKNGELRAQALFDETAICCWPLCGRGKPEEVEQKIPMKRRSMTMPLNPSESMGGDTIVRSNSAPASPIKRHKALACPMLDRAGTLMLTWDEDQGG